MKHMFSSRWCFQMWNCYKLLFQTLLVENPFVCMSLCFPNNSLLVFGPALLGWWMLSNEVPVKCMMQGEVGKIRRRFGCLSSRMWWQVIGVWVVFVGFLGGGFKYFFIFTPTWGNDPIWLIFFKWVETTNYIFLRVICWKCCWATL